MNGWSPETKTIFVKLGSDGDIPDPEKGERYNRLENSNNSGLISAEINSGTLLPLTQYKDIDWVMIPWNFNVITKPYLNRISNKWGILTKKYDKKAKLIDVWEEIRKDWNNQIKGKASGLTSQALNGLSMTLYTGPIKPHNRIGALYTGDYPAKTNFDKLKNAYKFFWG